MHKITKIFYSIQGEGTLHGTASIFVRFHGCNLDCHFCDDEYHTQDNYHTISTQALIDALKKYPSKTVILTGGEPSIYELNNMISALKVAGYYVCVETNGYNLQNIEKANWITYSPKDLENIHNDGFSEIKFIVNTQTDMTHILNLKTPKTIYIQPENNFETPNMNNVKHCIKLVEKHPHLKLSVQLHKFLGIE